MPYIIGPALALTSIAGLIFGLWAGRWLRPPERRTYGITELFDVAPLIRLVVQGFLLLGLLILGIVLIAADSFALSLSGGAITGCVFGVILRKVRSNSSE